MTIKSATSVLCDQLNKKMQDIATTETDRVKLRKQLFQARDHIKKQRKDAHHAKSFKNLRGGGWGKRAMQSQLPGMTILTTETGSVTDKQEISRHASSYYSHVFEHSDPHELMVRDFVKQDFNFWEYRLGICAEDIMQALAEAKRGRTCAADGLVSDT